MVGERHLHLINALRFAEFLVIGCRDMTCTLAGLVLTGDVANSSCSMLSFLRCGPVQSSEAPVPSVSAEHAS